MNNWFTDIIVAMVAAAMLNEADAKDATNREYIQSGPDGVFYARCIPASATGSSGFTEIYKVQKDRDERVDRYDWYTKHGLVLGWSPIAGRLAVVAIRPQPSDSLDKQVELAFYLGGKFLKSWTTKQLQSLGSDVVLRKPGGRMAMFQILGCEQIPGTNDYAFTIQIANEKKLLFDILTGDLYIDDSAKHSSRSVERRSVNEKTNPPPKPEDAPYEIVLEGEQVAFDKSESISSRIIIRNLGARKMIASDLESRALRKASIRQEKKLGSHLVFRAKWIDERPSKSIVPMGRFEPIVFTSWIRKLGSARAHLYAARVISARRAPGG